MELHLPKFEGNELIYRTGTAEPIEPLPVMERIEGDINTISSFIKKRYPCPSSPEGLGLQFVDKDRVIVTVDREKFSILVELDPEHPRGASIFGQLSLAPELVKFNINTGKSWSREDLVKLIRFNKMFFGNRDQADALEQAYMAFRAEVYANIAKTNDNRGNVESGYKKSVTTNIPESFVLNIPIFKGQDRRQIRVDIIIEATDSSARFFLESVDLHDITVIESDLILSKQLECCKDFVIVYK